MTNVSTQEIEPICIEIAPEPTDSDVPPGLYEQKSERFNPFFGREIPSESDLLPPHLLSSLAPISKLQTPGQFDRQLNSHQLKLISQQIGRLLGQLKSGIMLNPEVRKIEQHLNTIFPNCRVYGGAANELSQRDGDIDCTFDVNENEMEAEAFRYAEEHQDVVLELGFPLNEYCCVVSQVNALLQDGNFMDANLSLLVRRYRLRKALILAYYMQFLKGAFIPHLVVNARVPVLKFGLPVNFDTLTMGDEHDRQSKDVYVDVCVGNNLPPQNTALIATYMKENSQLRDLILIVKHWASKRDIGQSIELNSYFYILLVIFYMQQIGQLTRLEPGPFRVVQGMNCSFITNPPHVTQKYTIGQLLCGFFNFYGNYFDFHDSVISIRMGRALSRYEKKWNHDDVGNVTDLSFREHGHDLPFNEYDGEEYNLEDVKPLPLPDIEIVRHENKYAFIAVEDPFETFVNVARNCEYKFTRLVITEFRRAYAVLKRKDGLEWLFLTPDIDPPGEKQRQTLAELKAKEEQYSHVEVKVIQEEEKTKWGLT